MFSGGSPGPKKVFIAYSMITKSLAHLLQDKHIGEVARGATAAFLLQILGAGFSFVFNLVLARKLGAGGAGIYFLAITIIIFSSVIGRLGLDNSLLRFVASGAATGNWKQVAGVFRQGVAVAVTTSAAAATVLFFLAPWLSVAIFRQPELASPLRILSLAIIPFSVLNILGQMLKGVKRIQEGIIVQSVALPAAILGLLAIFSFTTLNVSRVTLLYGISALLVMTIGMVFWHYSVPGGVSSRGKFDFRKLMYTSFPLFWVTAMNLVMASTDTFMLGIFKDGAAVGLYNIAARTALLTSYVLIAVNSVVAPKFAALYARGAREELCGVARNASALISLVTLPVLLVFTLLPDVVLSLFGPAFIDAAPALIILALGQFVNVVTGSVGYLLMMCGQERALRNNILFMTALNVILNILLIPPYGVIGAALATASSLALKNVISLALVRHKLGFWCLPWRGKGIVS